jgi:hypothetical protein
LFHQAGGKREREKGKRSRRKEKEGGCLKERRKEERNRVLLLQ